MGAECEIYGKAVPYYALEGTYYWGCGLGLWGNADFLSRHGRSLGLCSPTEIKIANFSLGLKIAWEVVDCMRVYAGVGPSVAGVWLKNRSICLCENISKAAGGVVLKTGFDWRFWDNFMVNLSADYLLEPVSFPRKVDIGGLKIGLGVGVAY